MSKKKKDDRPLWKRQTNFAYRDMILQKRGAGGHQRKDKEEDRKRARQPIEDEELELDETDEPVIQLEDSEESEDELVWEDKGFTHKISDG